MYQSITASTTPEDRILMIYKVSKSGKAVMKAWLETLSLITTYVEAWSNAFSSGRPELPGHTFYGLPPHTIYSNRHHVCIKTMLSNGDPPQLVDNKISERVLKLQFGA